MPSRHSRRPQHLRRHATGAALVIAALAGAGLTGVSSPASAASSRGTAGQVNAATTVRPGLTQVENLAGNGGARAAAMSQTLSWKACFDAGLYPGMPSAYYRVQCATMIVPLDWDDPRNTATMKISVTRLLASTQPAAGVLFTNPGGPGGAGADVPLMFISAGRKVLIRTQDIYGMDVRGSGNSTNVTCGGPVSPYLDPRDRSQANVDLMLDAAQFAAKACDVAGGTVLDHVTTSQTVRDYELLRVLTRVDKINWIGYSAGTWLGAQYATTYPAHVGHFVLDSNTDFTSTWQTAFGWQPMGFERRFREDFLPWAAANNATYGLGSTPERVRQTYESVRGSMTAEAPVASAVSIDQLLASAMYDSALFPIAAQVLAELGDYVAAVQSGNERAMDVAASAIRKAGPLLLSKPLLRNPMSSDTSDAAFLAVTCNDTPWQGDRRSLAAQSEQAGQMYPLIGWSTIFEPCVWWNRPNIAPLPRVTGAGLPPVLMVQSEHDPATPMEGAQDALAHFSAGHMLTVTGSGDHGLYAGLNGCVNRAVEAFLNYGMLPAANCPGRALPDPGAGLSMASARAAAAGAAADSSSASSPAASFEKSALPAPGTNPLTALDMIHARLGS